MGASLTFFAAMPLISHPCDGNRCPTLKLAMVKNQRLARRLFQGELYDCICMFEEGVAAVE